MRLATYARFSCDLQRTASIEDQERECKKAAGKKGWLILSDFVRSDSGYSGATMKGRFALMSLVEAAKQNPRPFDCLMIDDTSRLGRNLTDVLWVTDLLKHRGVFLYFASQDLDSRDPNFRMQLIMHGMMDEQYIVALAAKVHRGQEGRVLAGMVAGGRCFGYRNVPIPDPTRAPQYGRLPVKGVRREIREDQAAIVRRIADLYGDGNSLFQIARQLNQDGAHSPSGKTWTVSAVYHILTNPIYRGEILWNRSRKVRNPETGKPESVKRPESEWVPRFVPELRIISEAQWERVEERLRLVGEVHGFRKVAGLNRAHHDYLLSGRLTCGECGGPIVLVAAPAYGCSNHKYHPGTCSNSLRIRAERLEHQVIGAIVAEMSKPEMIDYLISDFTQAYRRESIRIATEIEQSQINLPKLQQRQRQLSFEARNIVDAIAMNGPYQSPTLRTRLTEIECELESVTSKLEQHVVVPPSISDEKVREFIMHKAKDLESVFTGDRKAAKLALGAYLPSLTLTPGKTRDSKVYYLKGQVNLAPSGKEVMLLAAPQGFEPRYADPESAVLPLNEGAAARYLRNTGLKNCCLCNFDFIGHRRSRQPRLGLTASEEQSHPEANDQS